MAASIHRLASPRLRSTAPAATANALAPDLPSRLHIWRGRSRQRHLFTVYGLFECPVLPQAVYVLVQRDGDGRRSVLGLGRAEEASASLNLAAIRHRAAVAGANEVHVSVLPEPAARAALLHDLEPLAAVAAHRSEQVYALN